MESRKNTVAKQRKSASHATSVTAGRSHPPPSQEQGRHPRAMEDTGSVANVDTAGKVDDLDGDEWVEVDEQYEEVDEAEVYDRDDNMSEPSLGLGENQDDTEVEVNDNGMAKKGGKRKKQGGVVVKERRTRVKRAECWKHFKEVKAGGQLLVSIGTKIVVESILTRREDNYAKELYGREKGMREAEDIKTEFFDLYATYEMENRQNGAPSSNEHVTVSTRQTASSMSTLSSGFQSFLKETNSEPCKSELTSYLEDKTHPIQDPNFTLLDWWRLNAHRYPIMAKMAKKFLTVPATSVSSESTFSTGGRVLDDYRSSLRPKMVEALVCASSFIKGSKENHVKPTIIVEDDSDDDVEFIPFPESSVGSS